jgi:hypothetical protein
MFDEIITAHFISEWIKRIIGRCIMNPFTLFNIISGIALAVGIFLFFLSFRWGVFYFIVAAAVLGIVRFYVIGGIKRRQKGR